MVSQKPSGLVQGPPKLVLALVVLGVALLGILRGRELADMIKVIALRFLKEERP